MIDSSHCGGTADAPGLEPGAFGRVGANPTNGILKQAVVTESAYVSGSEPDVLPEVTCGCESHQRQLVCERCTGRISDWPAALANHNKKCLKARPYQRQYFALHGYWPSGNNLMVQFQNKSRSAQRAIAAYHTKS